MDCSDNEDGEVCDPLQGSQSGSFPTDTNSSLFNHYFNLALRQQQKNMPGFDLLGEQFLSNALMSLNNGSSHSTEDFCEICQKQFCNKYYLKKHKLDVHGVISNDTPKTKKINDLNSTSAMSVSPLLAPTNSSSKNNLPANLAASLPVLPSKLPRTSNLIVFLNRINL